MLGRLRMRRRRRYLYIADESRSNLRPYYRLTATAGLLFAGGAWLASQAPHPGEQHRIERTLLPPNVSDVTVDRTPAVSSRLQSTSAATADSVPAAAPAATEHAGTLSPKATDAAAASPDGWLTVTVEPGDSLWTIFKRLQLDPAPLPKIVRLRGAGSYLDKVHPGEVLRLRVGQDRSVREMVYQFSAHQSLHILQTEQGFRAEVQSERVETATRRAAAVIESSLFEAGLDAGLSERLVMELAEVFQYDIDFAKDLQPGDRFTILYEEHRLPDGTKLDDGAILAARFITQGRSFAAVRYTDPSGRTAYYTPEGTTLHRAFTRTPVKFSRITSGFTLRRYHPVLHRFRAHRGVDYAAPIGTPVHATGDGVVGYKGNKGGYGKTVVLQHGDKYSTLYAHLSRFARGVRQGSPVRQGQVIGYVGRSGLATGPHLHYEFRVDGVHRDPLTVKLAIASTIPHRYRDDFNAATQRLTAQLDLPGETQLALSSLTLAN